ncbi:DMT family transporter [Tamaricihabitans halophyticus]|uniref:DMT family transporter n=1 Tax=Tamaricihabitans halophyticus TaxID=1262583 RepID=UPI00104BE032|nr:multidrug efflux SMR transporter [Tamaricihabitans halophyticus]
MAWALLLVAALLELVWAAALKLGDGFSRLLPSAVGLLVAASSLVLLAVVLRILPMGTAYAVWVGIGAGGVALTGMVWFGEAVSPARLAFLGLILTGVIGLKLVDG